MQNKRWKSSNTAVYNLSYHLIWCPKYRRSVLTGPIAARFEELLYMKADEIDVVIERMEIMPDHIHMFVKATPVDSPHWIVKQFKGYTSRILREEFPKLKSRMPSLWTRSYYAESIGHISEDTIKRYIEDQKKV